MAIEVGVAVPVLLAAALMVLPRAGFSRSPRSGRRRLDARNRRALAVAIGITAVGVLLSVPIWLTLPVAAAGAAIARALPSRRAQPSEIEMRELASIFDLLAACLDAGLPAGMAITAVLQAGEPTSAHGVEGAAGTRDLRRIDTADRSALGALSEVSALLALGAEPQVAWRPAAEHPELVALAGAACRSALGGVRLADAARDSAAELRERCRRASERSAARAAVAMTAPLAVCFLPAFVCLGLAPVIIGLVSSMHIW